MKIAITYENGNVFQHFGHTEEFKFYEIENNEIKNSYVLNTFTSGHGALAGFLKENKTDVLICGGIGAGAQNALKEAGIKLFGGVSGSADKAAKDFINGDLDYNPTIKCSHHEGKHGHSCGEHNCGEHSCKDHSCH